MIGVRIQATNECIPCKNRREDEHGNLYCGADGADADLILCNTRKEFYYEIW